MFVLQLWWIWGRHDYNLACLFVIGSGEQDSLMLTIQGGPCKIGYIKLPYNLIIVSHFLFPGETQEESVKAVEEMLGFTPNFEHLDDELEIVASPQHIWVCILLFCSCQAVIRQSFGSFLVVFGHSSSKKPQKSTFIFFSFLRWRMNLEQRAHFWKRKEH